MKNKINLALICLLPLATGACLKVHESVQGGTETIATGHAGGAYIPENVSKFNYEDSEPVLLLEERLQRRVTCEGIEKIQRPEGRLEIKANFRNRTGRRLEVQVNCVFKDEQGFSNGDETAFQTIILTENAQETTSFLSMNDKARRFTIRMREPR